MLSVDKNISIPVQIRIGMILFYYITNNKERSACCVCSFIRLALMVNR